MILEMLILKEDGGGEEFAIILPRTNIYDARQKAEDLRKRISEYSFSNIEEEEPIRITISAGVAGSEYEDIMGKADEHLYMAKNSGRNRVCPLPEALKSNNH
ncbi:diguanylate cyclase [Candidatus Woesearchaeota archaeon]|nr:diguanylate cyclase [Candidatus Woesearchaeota archaeon]